MQVIGILQQQLIHQIAFGVSRCRVLVAIRAIFLRIDIRAAARQQNGVAALDLFHHLKRCLVQFDAHRLSACSAHGFFILWQRALGILAVILAISGMRHGDGNARRDLFQLAHVQLARSIPSSALRCR